MGVYEVGQGSLGLLAADAQEVRSRRVRPGEGRVGAVLPARRLLAGQGPGGTEPRQAQGTAGVILARSRAQPGLTATRRTVRLLRDLAAAAHDHSLHLRWGRPERAVRYGSAYRREIVRHRGRAESARRRRRGRHRCQRRLHRRIRVVGRRPGPTAPHLFVPGRRDLQASVHGADPDWRCEREDAVRGRRAKAGHRRESDTVGQRQADRRGQDASYGRYVVHVLRGYGHRP